MRRNHRRNRNNNFFHAFLQNTVRNLGKAVYWILNNPLVALTIFLALTACAWKLLGNRDNDGAKTLANLDKDPLSPNCPTIVFYEAHNDAAPAKMITKLLPRLVENNYRTFLFEEPKDMSISENIEVLKRGVLIFSQYGQKALSESYEVTIKLLERLRKAKVNYVTMDLDRETRKKTDEQYGRLSEKSDEIRELHMTREINSACKKYGAGQVVLVGVFHNSMEHRLRESGYSNVSSVYIIDHPIINDPALSPDRQDNDLMLRTKNLQYMQKYGYKEVDIINVYDNPDVNVTEAVLSGLRRRNPI